MQPQPQPTWPHAESASKRRGEYDAWYRRLVKVRDTLLAWNLDIARTVPPRILADLLTAVGVPGVLVDGNARSFRGVMASDARERAVAEMEQLLAAWKCLATNAPTTNPLLAIIERHYVSEEARRNEKRAAKTAVREGNLHRVLTTPAESLRVLYRYSDAYGRPRTARYPITEILLTRHTVRVAFEHAYTTMRGEQCVRDVCMAFRLTDLQSNDGGHSELLVDAVPVPATLKSLAALVLAQNWSRLDKQASYTAATQSIFRGFASGLVPAAGVDLNSSMDVEEEEEADMAPDVPAAAPPSVAVAAAAAAAPVAHVQVKVEVTVPRGVQAAEDDDIDFDMDLASRLEQQRRRLPAIPVPPPQPALKTIVIDLTMY